MNNTLTFLFLFTVLSCSLEKNKAPDAGSDEAILFDSELASELGADEYGMSKYVMAFLKKGPHRNQDSLTRAQLQRAHLDNMGVMAEAGKLVLAGPFMDDGDLRGIYIFAVDNLEEAQKLTESDPAIKAGILVLELHPWYGSAAVKNIPSVHKLISKKEI